MPFEEDIVRLRLNGDMVPIATEYSVNSGIFEVPTQFSMTVGHGGIFALLASKYPPRTRFELEINGQVFASGETDSIALVGADATCMKITGRDWMARLRDTQLLDDQTFSEKTYKSLVETALKEVGLSDRIVLASNIANRKAITGSTTVAKETPKVTEEEQTEAAPPAQQEGGQITRTVYRVVKAEIGSSWLDFINVQDKKVGLFLWATQEGNFVLSRPNGTQPAAYRIVRQAGIVSNVVGQPEFDHNTVERFSEALVFGRGGGGKHGRAKAMGRYIDQEMVAILNPNPEDRKENEGGGKLRKPKVIKDPHVRTKEHADLLARRVIAESRRNGWKLSYTVAGHTTPNGEGRLVWQPDTVVDVTDDQLGIEGPMYIESVEFLRSQSGTTTKLHLLRIEDLIFQDEPDEVAASKPKLAKKPGVALPDPTGVVLLFPWDKGPDQKQEPGFAVLTGPGTSEPGGRRR